MLQQNIIPRTQWVKMYTLALELLTLAPWNWMFDVDVFGVQHPDSRETGYCSIKGSGNLKHVGFYLFKGDQGLSSYELLYEKEYDHLLESENKFLLDSLVLTYLPYDRLPEVDKELVRSLSISENTSGLWPVFRDYTPGWLPWRFETSYQISWMTVGLEQTLEVARRFKEDQNMLDHSDEGDDLILIRTPRQEHDKIIWQDVWKQVESKTKPTPQIEVNQLYLKSNTSALSLKKKEWILDIFFFPTPISTNHPRPYFPKMLIAVDVNTFELLGYHIFNENNIEKNLQVHLVKLVKEAGYIPHKIFVTTYATYDILEKLTRELGIIIEIDDSETALDELKAMLFSSISL
ncbi:MAG: hypothetical protein AAF824_05750 [Bacteroidota bacterium]